MVLNEIFASFIKNLFKKDEQQIRYLSLTDSMMKKLPDFFEDDITVIDLKNNYSPLKPFLQILELNRFDNENEFDELIEKAVYSLHKPIFKSYFKYEVCEHRDDLLIDEELYYEKNRLKASIVMMMKCLFDKNLLILNAQNLSLESIAIIKDLEKTELSGKLVFCFDSIKVESAPKSVIDFFEEITNQKNFYDISNTQEDDEITESISDEGEFIPEFDVLYNSLNNNQHFLAVEQNMILAEWVSANIDKFGYTIFQRRAINLQLGIAYFFADRNDEATLFFNNVMESQFDDALNILALLYLSKVLFRKKSNVAALKYAILAERRLVNNKNSKLYALANMLDYMLTERSDNEKSIKKYEETLKLLKKAKLTNNYIKTILVVPWFAVSNKKFRPKILAKIQEAYDLANEIDNRFVLSSACHWKGIILSYAGNISEALDWYFKCNTIRTEIGDLLSIMKIRNGLSYEALIRAEYDTSYDLINSFIGRLDEVNDFAEVLNTLKNISFAMFYARHFDDAYKIFQKIIHFIHLFNLEETTYDSFVPEYNDMLIYKTFVDLEHGEITRAKINILNIMHNGRAISSIEEPLVKFLEAKISAEEGKIELSTEEFETSKEQFKQIGETQEHKMVFICYEYAKTLDELGYKELSEKYFNEGFKLATEKNFPVYTKFKSNLTLKEYLDDYIQLEPINVNIDYIEDKAEKQKLVNQLHESLHNYQFLNRIMGFSASNTNIQSFVYNTIQACVDFSMADKIFIFEKSDEKWKNLSEQNHETESNWPSEDYLDEIIKEKDPLKNSCLIFDSENQVYKANLSKFEFTGCFLLYQNKINPLTSEMINFMNIALSNIQAQLVMFKQNEHLIYISSTDQLSLLNNRRALQEFIKIENERLRRSQSKRKFVMQETIAFIDLDNFKYYNDTFGHEVGDLFITRFAQLLKATYRRVDFIARFGGDEFVVILADCSCQEGKRIAERLYNSLEKDEFFIPDLERFLNRKADVPKNKLLNFSMGLCSNYDLQDSTELGQVMTKADQALYYSKGHGKGSVSIWSEIKDLIPEEKRNHEDAEF